MFHYQDLSIMIHPEVYDPAEDTFLLVEAIEVKPKTDVFEIGTGCGIIALVCAKKGANVVCSDINPYAIETTKKNIENNIHLLKGSIDVRKGSMFKVLNKGEKFDIIIFNPPYLPTYAEEKLGGWFDIAVDGGRDGFKLIKPFLKGLSRHLKKNGLGYFISTSFADQKKLQKIIIDFDLRSNRIMRQSIGEEEIYIYEVKIK
ncbi:MAG: methyltransferase [Thermoplasmata archaeon]|nr:MAG: methyltransferase [Thermoplasmata archaeon]